MDLITPDLGLIFWTGLIFLLLMFILAKFIWKPIMAAVNTREQNIEEALELASKDEEIFIIGGAQIYDYALQKDVADALEITLVHNEFDADVFFPEIDLSVWKEVKREDFKADEKNKLDYSFVRFEKRA